MITIRRLMRSTVPLGLWLALGGPAAAQQGGIDVSYGPWWHGDGPGFVYSFSYYGRIVGPVAYGLGLSHLNDSRAAEDRTQTGATISLGVNRSRPGPYVLGTWGLGFLHSDGEPDAYWSVGAGYAVRPLRFLTLGIETAYRVEDREIRGFWQLDPNDRRGLVLQGRLAFDLGSRPARTPRRRPTVRPVPQPTPSGPAESFPVTESGPLSSEEAVFTRSQVVATALDAMGAPYRWGGNDANGYDCSGLIQYAYGEHGILLPRRSRDQARTGELVDRDVAALQPGDILGFTQGGGGISHVGLYVGDGEFIHSTSAGVKLSSLTSSDPDSRWWQQRWVTARRVLN